MPGVRGGIERDLGEEFMSDTIKELPDMVIEKSTSDFAFEGETTIWPWGKDGFLQRFNVFRMPDKHLLPVHNRIHAGKVVIQDDGILTIEQATRYRDAFNEALRIAEELENGIHNEK